MATMFFLCAIFVCVFCVQASQIIKVLYCQDPDTGNLYPVNSTWPSKSFCGNYTCKLRKKNMTISGHGPIRKINITNINIKFLESEEDMSTSPSENINIGKRIDVSLAHSLQKENPISKNEINTDKKMNISKDDKESDRYLTESEIKIITEMLHTVKKSDLEAIVDIYNLAQDIYKEIDKASTEAVAQETNRPIHIQNSKHNKQENAGKDGQRVSYWYEPLHFPNSKTKPQHDMHKEGTTLLTTKTEPTKNKNNPNIYFKGTSREKDLRKLPYYYPVSNFQRVSSYTHNGKQNNVQESVVENKPCKRPTSNTNFVLPPWINKSLKKAYSAESSRNVFEPSLLLPFPFAYVNNNNLSWYPPNFYYGGYPWAQLNVYNRNRNYQQSYLGTAYIAQHLGEHKKPELNDEYELHHNSITKEDIIDIISNLKVKEAKKMPDWQTDPLPAKVIEEVRGNAEKSKLIKAYPLRKKVKLERVGKVIKLDETERSKRSLKENENIVTDTDDFETYIEKTMCEPSTELGFFRRGNMSKPFPACCPERIES